MEVVFKYPALIFGSIFVMVVGTDYVRRYRKLTKKYNKDKK